MTGNTGAIPVLTAAVIANDPAEAVNASPFEIGKLWRVKEISVRLSPDCPPMGPAKWIVEAQFTQVEQDSE